MKKLYLITSGLVLAAGMMLATWPAFHSRLSSPQPHRFTLSTADAPCHLAPVVDPEEQRLIVTSYRGRPALQYVKWPMAQNSADPQTDEKSSTGGMNLKAKEDPPALSDKEKADILTLVNSQHAVLEEMQQTQINFLDAQSKAQTSYTNLQKSYDTLQAAIDKKVAELKFDRSKFTFDAKTATLKPIPPPSTPPATAVPMASK